MHMKYPSVLIVVLLVAVRIAAQEVPTQAPQPVFQVLSESTVQQRDGSSITFRQVVPPVIPPQAQSAAPVPAAVLSAAEQAALSQMPVKEPKVLSISASVQTNGLTVLRWTCGTSQRLQGVSNVDFRCLRGLLNVETEQASYFTILSAGLADQAMTEAEAQAAQALPTNGSASLVLLNGGAAASEADESALEAMDAVLNYFDTHREALLELYAQSEADRLAQELAARSAPPPPPKHSVIHFWPLQPAQRAAILETTQPRKGAQP